MGVLGTAVATAGTAINEAHSALTELENLAKKATELVTIPANIADQPRQALEKLNDIASKYLPTFSYNVTVSAVGGPGCDLRRLWYLTLAAAFGRYHRSKAGKGPIWGKAINARWDITGKACSVTIAATFSGLENLLTANPGATLLAKGPDQLTIGGPWPSFLQDSSRFTDVLNLVNIPKPLPNVTAFKGGIFRPGNGVARHEERLGEGQPSRATRSYLLWPTPLPDLVINQNAIERPVRMFPWNREPTGFPRAGDPNVFKEFAEGKFNQNGPLVAPYRCMYPFDPAGIAIDPVEYSVYERRTPLPDMGRVITTGEKNDIRVQPPRPAVDGLSRNHPLAMIAAALSAPGWLVEKPQPSAVPLASAGLYASAPTESIPTFDKNVSAAVEDGFVTAQNRVVDNTCAIPDVYALGATDLLPVADAAPAYVPNVSH